MIRFDRNGNGAVAPRSLTGSSEKGKNDNLLGEEHDTAEAENRPMRFNRDIYGCHDVKNQLKRISYGKCCYCDSYIEDVEYGDVEHFRPKSKYWWLAYTWENLLYACEICNRVYKKASFPIKGREASSPGSDLDGEDPLFINPIDEDPELYIDYDADGEEASIVPRNQESRERVEACIKYYGINRETLLNSRRLVLKHLKVYYALYSDPKATNNQKDIIKQQIRDMTDDGSEFAGMVRFYLKKEGIPV
ncbi:MAG: TIGR02646 family protein [Candidatus Altiarchaeales archaeon WOR_SM1_79]|nr:MAG: TIGR02646 family protein [Candidatus Altiarchaeales archaeon WOR_SM1_79]